MLPEHSFDRIFMVHMYHEIAEPYAFLWRLYPALKMSGEVIVVDANRPTEQHGTPPRLLTCELEAVGYRLVAITPRPDAGGYLARFSISGKRPETTHRKRVGSGKSGSIVVECGGGGIV